SPDLWNDPEAARKVMSERQALEGAINDVRALETGVSDNVELIEMGEAEGDAEIVREAEEALVALSRKAARMRVETLLSGEADGNDCFLEVHSGAGGTESQDWAQMLFRMYTRWAERRGFSVETIEYSAG